MQTTRYNLGQTLLSSGAATLEQSGNHMKNGFEHKLLILVVLLFSPCIFILNNTFDHDIWFLLNSGRYVLLNGIPDYEPFTLHTDFSFVMQQWLSACLFWLCYKAAGILGLKLLVIFVNAMIVYLVYLLCMRVSDGYFFVSFFIAMTASLMLLLFATARPGLLSTCVFAIELLCLENFVILKKPTYLIPLPILSVLLINLHAAIWPMSFVLMMPYLVESIPFRIGSYCNRGFHNRLMMLSLVGMILGGLINPYGLDGMTYLFRSFGYIEINRFVGEMHSPDVNSAFGIIIFGGLFLVIMLHLIPQQGKTSLRFLLLIIGTAFLALFSIRNIPIFVIGGLFPVAFFMKDYHTPMIGDPNIRLLTSLKRIIVLTIITLFLVSLNLAFETEKIVNKDIESLKQTVEWVISKNNPEEVVLYTGYNEGNLAEFYGLKPYIDTRAEVFVKANNRQEDIMKEFYDLQMGFLHSKKFLDKYHFTHLIVTRKDILFQYLIHINDYQITYSNEKYYLFESVKPFAH